LGLVGRHHPDISDLAAAELGELAHAHRRQHQRLAFAALGGPRIVLAFHDAHSSGRGPVTRAPWARPAPARRLPQYFPLAPIFPRFGPGRCGRKDSGPGRTDLDLAHEAIGLAPDEIDAQEAVAEIGRFHLDALGQHERAAELACGNAAVDKLARLVVLLAAADDE